ncbi:MAG: Carboxylic ester hydrolase [Aureobasidium pullulans]|nr:MAG: Carboxylic ester hydrolase [Aureobasidium pullulans]
MSSYAVPYNPQSDWWNQPVDGINRPSITQHYRSDSINASEYPPLQQSLNGDSGFNTSTQVNDAYQSNQIMPNYLMSDVFQFTEPSMSFAMLHHQAMQGDFTTQCIPSASLPPAAFSKEPLPIDQFSSNDLAAFCSTSPNSFYPSNNQILPISDVPALEYDSTSDGTAYSRRQWTDSPMPDEMEDFVASGDVDDSLENSDPCYAELLRQALMEKTDDHTMLLKDLYEWVRTHSSKAQDPSNKGWQNSVRHNLSMNAAFERVPPPNQEAGTKKTSYWRLTQHAVEHGISSTTRYRKDSKRKTQRNPNPAPIRVQAGAKGGQATRRSVRRQQLAASPLNGLSPSSDMARQRNLRRPHQLRQFPITQVEASSTQQRLPQDMLTSNTSSYFGNTADMFDNSNGYSSDNKVEENRDLLVPYGTAQSYLDWSVSPSPMGHAANEIGGWPIDQNTLDF